MTVYTIQNQWGGNSAPWHDGGVINIGNRGNQLPVALNIHSGDGGRSFTGTMTYVGEGPIGFRGTLVTNNCYHCENQWGGDQAPWHDAGLFLLGGRDNQRPVAFALQSHDAGNTIEGTMTYAGEGPIGFRGTRTLSDTYSVANQWGGDQAPWHPGGTWVLGCRGTQLVTAISFTANGANLSGTMNYAGEGPIGLQLVPSVGQ
ncbi:MAG: hypothetical protein A4S12_12820 [Proteobacteria bacterium SG_bin5]|nr:MAG: hypothetical protein A4S12_12820 [Proteobacteria bacterium SG_bin5]